MKDEHYVIGAPVLYKNHLNEAIVGALKRIQERGGLVSFVGCVLAFSEDEELTETPIMKTPDGRRLIGVREINEYANNFVRSKF